MTYEEILDLPFEDESTIRQELCWLLGAVLKKQEGFSGKRPDGDSDYYWRLYGALGRGGAIKMTFDEDGFIDEFDHKEADHILSELVDYVFYYK